METLDALKNELWPKRNDLKFDDDGIEESIRHGLRDFTFRTEKKKTKEKFGVEEMFKVLADKDFVNRFKQYFKENSKDEENFDKWHKETCKVFLKALGDVYEKLSYGKAQKIVNMTFKYAYCLPGAEKKKMYFKHCHMPLDSFTLQWFKRDIVKNDEIRIRDNEHNRVGLIPNWSNIRSEDDWTNVKKSEINSREKIPYCYEEITKAIRDYLALEDRNDNLKKGDIVLENEFYIWEYTKFALAVESIWKFFAKWDDPNGELSKKESEEFKNKKINDKLDYLHEKFSDVEKYKI